MRPTTLSLVALGAALSSCVSVVPLDHEARALKDRSVGEAVVEIQGDHRHSTKPVPGPTSSTSTTSASSTSTFAPTISTSLSAVSSNVIKTSTSTSTSIAAVVTNKPVFFHYMVGEIYSDHCKQDKIDAQALGVDAFALNLSNDVDSWSTDTIASVFWWADVYDFKLFFSFDMSGFSNPSQFTTFLGNYVQNSAYFTYNGLPLVSTFNGGASGFTFGQASVNEGWKVGLIDVMADAGHSIYFVPAFDDVSPSTDFFDTYSALDGAMNWDSWPFAAGGIITVPTDGDELYQNGAHAVGKTFMMGVSPLQFKHIDASQNWYRRGEANLKYRFGQVLAMQPDFVELQTWNDAGESHYMGNSWPEPISGTAEGAYTENYNHTGYQEILPAFIKAYKAGFNTTDTMFPTNGKTAQGVFWHHTLLVGGDCSADVLGKPSAIQTAEDRVTVVVLVESGYWDYTVSITSGNTTLRNQALVPGYNQYSVSGLTVGKVNVKITELSSGLRIVHGTGPIAVTDTADLCNYNFQVVALS